MWPRLKPDLLEPGDLCKPVDWEKHDGFNIYAFYPPVTNQYPRGHLLYTKAELDKMNTTYETHKITKAPADSGIFYPGTTWPPPMSFKTELSPAMREEISEMKYEDIRRKYPFLANDPASPFVEKRLADKLPNSWECDDTKVQTDEQILATLGYPTVVSRDGKQRRPSKFPALHSDGYHAIHPSWYYQPSTYVKYVNSSKGLCQKLEKKKASKTKKNKRKENEIVVDNNSLLAIYIVSLDGL